MGSGRRGGRNRGVAAGRPTQGEACFYRFDADQRSSAPDVRRLVLGLRYRAMIFIIDDDAAVREALRALLETAGHAVEDFPSAEAFLV
jgi:PleD family two-component response regulator